MSTAQQTPPSLVSLSIAQPAEDPKTRAELALSAAEARVIATNADYADVADELKAVKAKWNELDEQRKSLVKPIDEARTKVQDLFRAPLSWLEKAEAVLKRKLVDYQNEQERLRREEQRKLEEDARRERQRIEAAARETERKAREKAENDRRAAAEAEAAGRTAEAAKLNERAAATESKAAVKSEQLAQQAATVVAPIVQREAPKVAGIKTRDVWLFEITDPAAIPREYLSIDEKRIGQVVKAMKSDTRIPGVRVYKDNSIAAGAR